MIKKYIFNKMEKKRKKTNFEDISFEIILNISEYLGINDIINLTLVNKKLYKIFNIVLIELYKNNCLLKDYYDIIYVDKKTKNNFNVKSYMLFNQIKPFIKEKQDKYLFICKIYLDEIKDCDHLPNEGSLKFYMGPKIDHTYVDENGISIKFKNIFKAKIVYKNETNYNKKNIGNILYNRKYIIIKKLKTLPLSYMRNLYFKNNININNEEQDKNCIYKFSNNYLFGPSTYHNLDYDPVDEITLFDTINNNYYTEWILNATFNPSIVLPDNQITNEMISFVIRKKDLKECNFNDVFVIYENEINNDDE